MADASQELSSGFYVRQLYDFSKAYGVFFHWWGADKGDIVTLKLETPTGNFVTSFSDGPAEFREVFIPWRKFNPTGHGGTPPDKNRITGILWTVYSPGLRRLDRFGIYETPILRGMFNVRAATQSEVKSSFTVEHSSQKEMKAEFAVA